jgi:hypothetical protein
MPVNQDSLPPPTPRAEGERVLAHLADMPEARAELEAFGTPMGELP